MPAWVSWVALKVCATGASDALAVGTVSAPMATSPEATEIIRARLAMPLRGVVRLILTGSFLPREVGGPRGVGAREAQPAARRSDSGFRNVPKMRCP
ncbi:hypothetical protein GCM10009646_21880 [Streptomyces aureus]